ncbi:hypothetical protein HK405_000289, partial [Cladochytrium tenue]
MPSTSQPVQADAASRGVTEVTEASSDSTALVDSPPSVRRGHSRMASSSGAGSIIGAIRDTAYSFVGVSSRTTGRATTNAMNNGSIGDKKQITAPASRTTAAARLFRAGSSDKLDKPALKIEVSNNLSFLAASSENLAPTPDSDSTSLQLPDNTGLRLTASPSAIGDVAAAVGDIQGALDGAELVLEEDWSMDSLKSITIDAELSSRLKSTSAGSMSIENEERTTLELTKPESHNNRIPLHLDAVVTSETNSEFAVSSESVAGARSGSTGSPTREGGRFAKALIDGVLRRESQDEQVLNSLGIRPLEHGLSEATDEVSRRVSDEQVSTLALITAESREIVLDEDGELLEKSMEGILRADHLTTEPVYEIENSPVPANAGGLSVVSKLGAWTTDDSLSPVTPATALSILSPVTPGRFARGITLPPLQPSSLTPHAADTGLPLLPGASDTGPASYYQAAPKRNRWRAHRRRTSAR